MLVIKHAHTSAWPDVMMQGMLAIGAALLGSPAVLGIDIDADALEVAQQNCEQFEDPLPVRVLVSVWSGKSQPAVIVRAAGGYSPGY